MEIHTNTRKYMIYIDSHSFFEESKQFGCSDSEILVTEFPFASLLELFI